MLRSFPDTRYNPDSLASEIVIHASLKHTNIAPFLRTYQDNTNFYIVTELSHDGSLGRMSEEQLDPSFRLSIVKQLFEAVKYLQSRGVVHRDILDVTIVFSGSTLKLIDFGVSCASNFEDLVRQYRLSVDMEGRGIRRTNVPIDNRTPLNSFFVGLDNKDCAKVMERPMS